MSVNRVFLMGRLGQDPDIRQTSAGQSVVSFSLATNESWTDKNGQRQERTEWHKITAWGKLAELCSQHLRKGSQAFIEGKIQTRSWQRQDGQQAHSTEIQASSVQFLGARPERQPEAADVDPNYDQDGGRPWT